MSWGGRSVRHDSKQLGVLRSTPSHQLTTAVPAVTTGGRRTTAQMPGERALAAKTPTYHLCSVPSPVHRHAGSQYPGTGGQHWPLLGVNLTTTPPSKQCGEGKPVTTEVPLVPTGAQRPASLSGLRSPGGRLRASWADPSGRMF